MKLNLNSPHTEVISVYQGVYKAFPKCILFIVWDGNAEHAYLQFLFYNAGLKQKIHFFERLQKRGVHGRRVCQNIHAIQHLKQDFMARDILANISLMPNH